MPNRTTSLNQFLPEPLIHSQGFLGLGIAPRILDVLEKLHFKNPTPIQNKAIPLAIAGKDVVGIAQTGTGKTHSFAIPLVQRLAQSQGKGLVLAPTRELAVQIEDACRALAHAFHMRTSCLIGGASMHDQIRGLRKGPRIIIATPGRLLDHIEQKNVSLHDVGMLILDEADRMLDMGFAPQINQVFRLVPRNRQTMLFSATIPREIMEIAAKQMKLPVSVEIAPSGTIADRVTQEVFIIPKDLKIKLLEKILTQYRGPILIFSRTKHHARKLASAIRAMSHSAVEIHSDRSLSQRREALEGFKTGRYKILVATDIASRGIDVAGIELVVNFDLPDDIENYVHRIGRTGRAGQRGHAISFAMPDQSRDIRNIEQLIKASLPISKHPEFPATSFIPAITVQTGRKPFAPRARQQKFQPRRGFASRSRRRPW